MTAIRAIYENGVFHPLEPVDLPDGTLFELRVVKIENSPSGLDAIYEVLSRRHSTGEHDLAARHNEHQP